MQLNQQAKKKLKEILIKDLGENAECFSDEELNQIGLKLLQITALILKHKTQ